MSDWELYGFIQKDGHKYYMRNLINEEGLVYDFDVSLGDIVSIDNPFGFMPIYAEVVNIDSVLVLPENKYRKRIKLYESENFFYEEYWIEGIGSMAGITASGWDMTLLTGGDDYTLLCFYESDVLTYLSTIYSTCFFPNVGVDDFEDHNFEFSIYPNPVTTSSIVKLNVSHFDDLNFWIYNYQGKLLAEKNLQPSDSFEINASDFLPGIYLISVMIDGQVYKSDKFVIQ